LKRTRYLFPFCLLGTTFVLLSVVAGARLLYGADLFVGCAVQSLASELLDLVTIFLSAAGSWELSGALLLALLAGLYGSGRRQLAGRLLIAFLATGLLEYMLKQFLPVPPILPDIVMTKDFVLLTTVGLLLSLPQRPRTPFHDPFRDYLCTEFELLFARRGNAATVGDVGEPGISRSALGIGRRGRSTVGRRHSLDFW
jgi:hypothetical protein